MIGQMGIDTTSRQVLNTTESVGGQILTSIIIVLAFNRICPPSFLSILRRFCREKLFDGKKKTRTYYVLEIVQLIPKKNNSCYILEAVQAILIKKKTLLRTGNSMNYI